MKIFEEIDLLDRLIGLIRRKQTGPPEHLAEELGVSRSQVYRYIDELENLDMEIKYNKKKRTFYCEKETFLKFKMTVVEDGVERKIKGGENKINYFEDFLQRLKKWDALP